jgi:translocation and assembly module TamB
MKRLSVRILLAVTLLLMTLVGAMTLVLATEPGTRWLLSQARAATALQYRQVHGSLLTGLRLEQPAFTLPGGEYRAETLELSWHPAGIVWGALVVETLAVSGLEVHISSKPAEPQADAAASWPELGLPIAIVVRELILERGHVVIDQQGYYLNAAHASARYGPGRAIIDELTVRSAASQATLSASAELSYPYALTAELSWGLQALAAGAHRDDVMRQIPAEVLTRAPAGQLTVSGDITELALNTQLSQPVQVSLEGHYRSGLDDSPAGLEATLSWPRQGLAALGLELGALAGGETAGQLQVKGWLDAYQATLTGEVFHPDYPALTLTADATGDTQQVQLKRAQLNMAQARVKASGTLGWQEGLTWEAALQAQHLDPQILLPEWPGDIQAELTSQGWQQADALNMTINVAQLAGQLRDLQLGGQGAVSYNGKRWQFSEVALALGANQVAVKGQMGERYALEVDLQAPLLAQIDASLGGSVTAQGQLTGTLANPNLQLNAQGQDLQWQDYQVGRLSVTSAAEGASGGRAQVTAEARELQLAGTQLEALDVALAGEPEQHSLSLAVVADAQNQLQLALGGGWNGQQWRGAIEQLQLRSDYAQTLTMPRRASLQLAADRAQLGSLCLMSQRERQASAGTAPAAQPPANTNSSSNATALNTTQHSAGATDLCLAGQWQAQGLTEAELTIERLPLALLQPWLKEAVAVGGYLHGGGSLRWPAAGKPVAELALAAREAALQYQPEDELETYRLERLQVDATLTGPQLAADLTASFVDYGTLQGSLSAHTGSRALQGKVSVSFDNLTPLEALLPAVDNLQGSLQGAINVAGTLDQPSASVDLQLTEAALGLPSLGVNLAELEARVQGDQQRLTLALAAAAGEGQLQLNGEARKVLSADWQASASVTGERAHIMNTPELALTLTPDITIKAEARALDISGSATVVQAHGEISTLPVSATQVSDDVIVVDTSQTTQPAQAMALNMNLDVILGDNVTLNAAGFKARLGGRMSLNKTPQRAMYAVGTINIIEGRYQSYGQDLSIEKGTLSFQGPLDNPGLNVTATRKVEATTVGLVIGGTLQKPVTEIFSRPQVSDSNAMSMLFTGKPLGGASSGEGALLVNAIAKLGIKRSQFLIDDIAGRLGLDELTIKADDDVQDSQLWLGKYLTEDLYVHYAIGLFDSLSSVGLTYFLSDNFRIEAESGAVQSADFMFNMER